MKMTVFWDDAPCDIGLMIEAVSTSETSVYFYQTKRRYIPENSNFHESSVVETPQIVRLNYR
jgi:hypothetical protein